MKNLIAIATLLAGFSVGCDASSTRCGHVAAPVSLGGARPLTVRADFGSLWIGARSWSEPRAAWAFPASGPVDDVVLHVLPDGYSVTFRQGGLLWRGELDADRTARGPLQALPHPVDPDSGRIATRSLE